MRLILTQTELQLKRWVQRCRCSSPAHDQMWPHCICYFTWDRGQAGLVFMSWTVPQIPYSLSLLESVEPQILHARSSWIVTLPCQCLHVYCTGLLRPPSRFCFLRLIYLHITCFTCLDIYTNWCFLLGKSCFYSGVILCVLVFRLHTCLCTTCMQCQQRPKADIKSPDTGIASYPVGAGIEPEFFARATRFLEGWAIFLACLSILILGGSYFPGDY